MRQQWIDRAKGVAMLMVVLGHTYGKAHFVYGIHLVIFFILAGYLLKPREITTDFVAAKFKRLMVPYFYTCLAIAGTDVARCVILRGGGQHDSKCDGSSLPRYCAYLFRIRGNHDIW